MIVFLRFLDYILAYEIDTTKDREWQQKREEKRIAFEANLERENLELEAEGIEVCDWLKLHTCKYMFMYHPKQFHLEVSTKHKDLSNYIKLHVHAVVKENCKCKLLVIVYNILVFFLEISRLAFLFLIIFFLRNRAIEFFISTYDGEDHLLDSTL